MYQALRDQLMEILRDNDLDFRPGGKNPSLGALCLEIGEVEVAYIKSFETYTLDFSYRYPEPEIAGSVSQLAAWFKSLDSELEAIIGGLSEEEIQNRQIDRGAGFRVLSLTQLQIYNEAILIFYGKVSVYLKMINKVPSERWVHWIG
jgi:hypothetical protein